MGLKLRRKYPTISTTNQEQVFAQRSTGCRTINVEIRRNYFDIYRYLIMNLASYLEKKEYDLN